MLILAKNFEKQNIGDNSKRIKCHLAYTENMPHASNSLKFNTIELVIDINEMPTMSISKADGYIIHNLSTVYTDIQKYISCYISDLFIEKVKHYNIWSQQEYNNKVKGLFVH